MSSLPSHIPRAITAEQLQSVLSELRSGDLLVPSKVRNPTIVRDGVYIGYIDLRMDHCALRLFEEREEQTEI